MFKITINIRIISTGKIIYACLNFPGSWHDTSVSQDLVAMCLKKLGRYAMCVDQGFPRNGDLYDVFVGPLSKRQRVKLTGELKDAILSKCEVYVSLRQASEWGMRALQGSFSRLRSRLTSNKEKRHTILLCCSTAQFSNPLRWA